MRLTTFSCLLLIIGSAATAIADDGSLELQLHDVQFHRASGMGTRLQLLTVGADGHISGNGVAFETMREGRPVTGAAERVNGWSGRTTWEFERLTAYLVQATVWFARGTIDSERGVIQGRDGVRLHSATLDVSAQTGQINLRRDGAQLAGSVRGTLQP